MSVSSSKLDLRVLLVLAAVLGLGIVQASFAVQTEPVYVDVSRLQPGGMKTVRWGEREVWVVRRSRAQVRALWDLDRDPVYDFVHPSPLPPQADPHLRSVKREYLVFLVNRHKGKVYLRLEHASFPCREFGYFPDLKRYLGTALYGGMYCELGMPDDIVQYGLVVYDLTGRARTRWIAPFEVPPHHFTADGVLVLEEST